MAIRTIIQYPFQTKLKTKNRNCISYDNTIIHWSEYSSYAGIISINRLIQELKIFPLELLYSSKCQWSLWPFPWSRQSARVSLRKPQTNYPKEITDNYKEASKFLKYNHFWIIYCGMLYNVAGKQGFNTEEAQIQILL